MTPPAADSGSGGHAPVRLEIVPASPSTLQAMSPALDRLITALVVRATLGRPPLGFRAGLLTAGPVEVGSTFVALADFVDPYMRPEANFGWLAGWPAARTFRLAEDERLVRGALLEVTAGFLWHCRHQCAAPMPMEQFEDGVTAVLRALAARSPWLRWLTLRCAQVQLAPTALSQWVPASPATVGRWLTGDSVPRAEWVLTSLAAVLDIDLDELRERTDRHSAPALSVSWDHISLIRRVVESLGFTYHH